MSESVDSLILDLLEWIGPEARVASEVVDAWRTSCPRLPVWEEANERGFVERRRRQGRDTVSVTALGRDFLEKRRGGRSVDQVGVRGVESSERERAVALQVLAFGRDPIVRWLYPEADAYLRNYPELVRAFGGRAFEHGTAYVAGEFAGVSLWLPVGVHVDPDPLVALFRATLGPAVLEDTFAILEKMAAFHIEEPHWYLPIIGVDPAQQGKGVGAALLRHKIQSCDAEGLPAYLESSNPANVPLYHRHGFELLGEIQVGSSPTLFPMLRMPR